MVKVEATYEDCVLIWRSAWARPKKAVQRVFESKSLCRSGLLEDQARRLKRENIPVFCSVKEDFGLASQNLAATDARRWNRQLSLSFRRPKCCLGTILAWEWLAVVRAEKSKTQDFEVSESCCIWHAWILPVQLVTGQDLNQREGMMLWCWKVKTDCVFNLYTREVTDDVWLGLEKMSIPNAGVVIQLQGTTGGASSWWT